MTTELRKVPELDGLRGLAAVGVVLFHWFPTYTFWMWSFVDLFFVLSGFLISRIIIVGVTTQTFSLKNFWIRRILRIWPVYYLALSSLCVVTVLKYGWSDFVSLFGNDALLSAVFLQFTQYYFLTEGPATEIFFFLPAFLHSWSLAVEEQFYLLWPLLIVLLLPRLGGRPLALLCLSLLVIGFYARNSGMQIVLLLTRIDGLALGALLALMHTSGQAQLRSNFLHAATYFSSILLGFALCGEYLFSGYVNGVNSMEIYTSPHLVSGFSLFYFGLVGLTIHWTGHGFFWALRTKPMVYLGAISYALYMFHLPILGYVKPRIYAAFGTDYYWLSVMATGIVLILVPHLSRLWVEKPILNYKSAFNVVRLKRMRDDD